MALKMAHDSYFYLGEKAMIRDSIARVYPVWQQKKNLPLSCYIHGMYAFGWEETQFYAKAEEQAKMVRLNGQIGVCNSIIDHFNRV